MIVLFLCLLAAVCRAQQKEAYFHKSMVDIMKNDVYLGYSDHSEFTVASAGNTLQLMPNDFITRADTYRMLSGDLSEYLTSGEEEEVVVPVVDTDFERGGGHKFLGFVLVKPIHPRNVFFRRGNIAFDPSEGGVIPSLADGSLIINENGAFTSNGKPFVNPPEGGGACISSRDCFNYNGTCTKGTCSCKSSHAGTYCQIYLPELSEIKRKLRDSMRNAFISENVKPNQMKPSDLYGKGQQAQTQAQGQPTPSVPNNANENAQASSSIKFSRSSGSGSVTTADSIVSASEPAQNDPIPSSSASATGREHTDIPDQDDIDSQKPGDVEAAGESGGNSKPRKKLKPGAKRKPKPQPGINPNDEQGGQQQQQQQQHDSEPQQQQQSESTQQQKRRQQQQQQQQQQQMNNEEQEQEKKPEEINIEDFYGVGKPYPEPYLAGKVPNSIAYSRFESRSKGLKFVYSVRFRSGPFGISFDNKVQDGTMVEKVVQGQAAQLSDIQPGDYLIAVNQFNMTGAPAKITQRMLTSLPFPVILVFEARGKDVDPHILQEEIKKRTLNLTIIYPPTLASEFQIRIAEWTPNLNVLDTQKCGLYYFRTPKDQFGCSLKESEYTLPDYVQTIVENNGNVDIETQEKSPMLTLMLKEGHRRALQLPVHSLGISKRGICTFVERATLAANNGADLALVVNSDSNLAEMPQGKEKLTGCTIPSGIMTDIDGSLPFMSAMTSEVIAVITDSRTEKSAMCKRTVELAEDITDKWAHSVPHVASDAVLSTAARTRKRGISDEGGRLAVAGENGWAFFDYHLAMFGPQVVPLGAQKFVMANPPHGCDPNKYTVRVAGAAVGILRGGGCSFGIKVINAQKLGAASVVILNTDDKATMRLMALPDEVPLINIPCIMVSRRLQFYIEEKLIPFYQTSQHIIAMQPTGIFGEYEDRNTLELPLRLPGQ